MTTEKESDMNKNVEAHLKVWLLQGRKITHNQALRLWRTNRLAEFIRRLRRRGMNIKTELVSEDGDVYGVYSLEENKKENRIKSLN